MPFTFLSVQATRGTLSFSRWHPDDPRPPTKTQRVFYGTLVNRSGYGGDDVIRSGRPFFGTATNVRVEAWLLALPFAAIVVAQLVATVRRRRRIAPGHCARCGYDLRATPERCPECGMANGSAG